MTYDKASFDAGYEAGFKFGVRAAQRARELADSPVAKQQAEDHALGYHDPITRPNICPSCALSADRERNETDPATGRTQAEERLVTWDYYLDLAIVAAERDPARALLLESNYDIAKELRDLKDALSWPSPSGAARALAERALGAKSGDS